MIELRILSRAGVSLTGLLVAGFITIAGHASPAAGAEQRCTELGANCSCSEPLNTNLFTTFNSSFVNPADSTTKQCVGESLVYGGASYWSGGGNLRIDAESGMPSGNTVNWVWTSTQTSGTTKIDAAPPASATRRMCSRLYAKFSNDYQGTGEGSCQNNKIMWAPQYQSSLPNSENYVTQGGGAPSWGISHAGFSTSDGVVTGSGSILNHHDCMTSWCRFEMCMGGNVLAGTNLYVDGSVVVLNDGRTQTFPRTFIGNANGAPANRNQPYLAYRQGTCAGTRSVSHVISAEWTTDAGQHIGKAYEVEGGGGTTPPPPVAPPAPTLLP